MKFTFIVFILLLSINNYGQQTVSKSEVIDAKIELYENKIDSKLRELDLKEDNLELSKQNVADIINFNKRKSLELKNDIDALKQSMEESLEKIKKESEIELNLIRAEAKRQMDHFKND